MASSDDSSRSIPFGVRRGTGQDPADRVPRRGATTGIGADGQRVVNVPGEGVHDHAQSPPLPVPTQAPNVPDPKRDT
jgi:hypothetical protein